MKDLSAFYKDHETSYGADVIRARAREDAAKNIPRPDVETPAPYEMELMHSSRLLASKVAGEFKKELEEIDAAIKARTAHVHRKFEDDLAANDERYRARRDALDQSFALKQARSHFETVSHRFNNKYAKLGRMPIEYIPHWLYVLFALLIFLGEIPLNALVFEIFGENQVMTWVMAFIIGLCVPLMAHFIGIKFREHGEGFSWPNFLKGAGALLLILGALYGLSYMRTVYLGENREDLGLTQAMVDTSILFYYLNVAVLFAAVIVSYLAHDPVPGYQRLYNDYLEAQRKVALQERYHERAIEELEIERAQGAAAAREQRCDGLDEVGISKGKYDRILKEGQEQELRCLHQLGKQLAIYRHENLSHRADQATPKSFNTELTFPLALQDMKEKLINEENPQSAYS